MELKTSWQGGYAPRSSSNHYSSSVATLVFVQLSSFNKSPHLFCPLR